VPVLVLGAAALPPAGTVRSGVDFGTGTLTLLLPHALTPSPSANSAKRAASGRTRVRVMIEGG
jgi:hypothetical protein